MSNEHLDDHCWNLSDPVQCICMCSCLFLSLYLHMSSWQSRQILLTDDITNLSSCVEVFWAITKCLHLCIWWGCIQRTDEFWWSPAMSVIRAHTGLNTHHFPQHLERWLQ